MDEQSTNNPLQQNNQVLSQSNPDSPVTGSSLPPQSRGQVFQSSNAVQPTVVSAHQPLVFTTSDPKRSNKKKLVTIAVILVLIVAGGLFWLLSYHKTSPSTSQSSTSTQGKSSTTRQTTNSDSSFAQQNTARTEDGDRVLAAVASYMANNTGNLPAAIAPNGNSSIYICNANCTASNSDTASLSFYKSQDILLKSYTNGLTIPNAATMYVVTGATCSTNGNFLGGQSATSVVVLYAMDNGNSPIVQQCEQ